MYDDKRITIIKRSNLEIDDNGVCNYTFNTIGEYLCDIQPLSSEKCIKIFGEYPLVKYQIWLEKKIEGFNEDTIEQFKVIYNDKEYKINKMILWDEDWYCSNFCISRDNIGDSNGS